MKVGFCDKLFKLLNEFENQNENEKVNQLLKTPSKKTEEAKSFCSTSKLETLINTTISGSSFNQRTTKKTDLSYEQHKSKDHFQEVDQGLSALRQKISVKAKNELITLRKPYLQTESQMSRNKIQKKLDYLNTDCFYKTSRAFYKNKPIVSFNLPIFSLLTNSLEMNSPTKKAFLHKNTISDLVNSKKVKQFNVTSELINKKPTCDSLSGLKKIENNINPLSLKEKRKQKEVEDLNKFKNFK